MWDSQQRGVAVEDVAAAAEAEVAEMHATSATEGAAQGTNLGSQIARPPPT